MSEFYDNYYYALEYINGECERTDEDFRNGVLQCLIEISENLNKIANKCD